MASRKEIVSFMVLKSLFTASNGSPNWPIELIWLIIMIFLKSSPIQIICNRDTTIILHRPTGKVYACGDNWYGQLGPGTNRLYKSSSLGEVSLPNKIESISNNSSIFYAYDTDYRRHKWGSERDPDVELSAESESMISDKHMPNTISCGLNYKLFLGKDTNLYIRGNNTNLGVTRTDGLKPIKFANCSIDLKIIQIGSVGDNSFVLTTRGLYGWGSNYKGYLGLGDTITHRDPIKLTINNIIIFSLGQFHAMALDTNNDLWGWGLNDDAQLGLGDTVSELFPQKNSLRNIVSVACGCSYTIALDTDGNVWSWGYNFYGQLGIGSENNSRVSTPQKLELMRINAIICCPMSAYNFAISSDGEVWSWGENICGQLGLEHIRHQYSPQELEFKF